ncbi:hypothetical protein N8I77_007237 [Diaporthe amygdali]|uniref:Rhodopsin domain-containing protein n=1 Tax=Phomopsis amygdali TaxID=1214568 RepID=A0AAD9SCG4_PHOAM|nr:hypothetical protein N8I77_007237 [Diaporthe amygdali]
MSSISDIPTSSLQKTGIALEVLFPLLSLITVSMRVYARLVTRTFGWDDGLIIAAMLLAIGLAVTAIFAMRTMYIGIHYWNVPMDWDYKRAFIWTYAMGVIYMPILSIVKISVLLFILRFSGVKNSVRYIVWGNGIFNLLLMISVFFVMLFDCVPFAKNWDSTLDGYCVDVGKFSLASSIFAIVTDVIAIALPFYIFWSLNMSMRKKLGLMLIFSVSIL